MIFHGSGYATTVVLQQANIDYVVRFCIYICDMKVHRFRETRFIWTNRLIFCEYNLFTMIPKVIGTAVNPYNLFKFAPATDYLGMNPATGVGNRDVSFRHGEFFRKIAENRIYQGSTLV